MRSKSKIMPRFCLMVSSVIVFILIGGASGLTALTGLAAETDEHRKPVPMQIQVILERVYLDGEVSQEVVNETFWSMENFWAKYDQWQVIDIDESTVVFRQQMDDISPLLKANGFFGITEDGVLTIFNGRPDRSKIIQSFFQIDMKKLESFRQRELLQGIPIKTKDRYVEVLQTFQPYSIKKQ